VSARQRRSARDRRRRTHGQNLLVDERVVDRLLGRLELCPDDLVVDVGAGRGALTIPLARAGVDVLAIERDPHLTRDLQAAVERAEVADRVRIRRADLREVRWPSRPYRVVANPPFGLTTALLARLLDEPSVGPTRADLLLQHEVARKRAAHPPSTLRSAAWAPWWSFELGERVPARAFRPIPAVDAAWLTIRRRDPAVLPPDLAGSFESLLRPAWERRAAGGGRPGRR
jgi:23S rRNA (adenine-N6)-dimethyltransferase